MIVWNVLYEILSTQRLEEFFNTRLSTEGHNKDLSNFTSCPEGPCRTLSTSYSHFPLRKITACSEYTLLWTLGNFNNLYISIQLVDSGRQNSTGHVDTATSYFSAKGAEAGEKKWHLYTKIKTRLEFLLPIWLLI